MGKTEKIILRSTGEQVQVLRKSRKYTEVIMPNGSIQVVQNRKLGHIRPQPTIYSLAV